MHLVARWQHFLWAARDRRSYLWKYSNCTLSSRCCAKRADTHVPFRLRVHAQFALQTQLPRLPPPLRPDERKSPAHAMGRR